MHQKLKYEIEVKRMTVLHTTSRVDARGVRSILPLLAKLGCRCMRYDRDNTAGWFNDEFEQPGAEHETLLVQTLLEVLRSNFECHTGLSWVDQIALLDGLVRNERWRTCLRSQEDAHMFALLLLDCSQLLQNVKAHPMEPLLLEFLVPGACAMLNMWLSPTKPFDGFPVAGVLAPQMFGDAWYYTVLNGEFDIKLQPCDALRTRPPFVQGLLPNEQDYSVSLPGTVAL